MLDEPDRNGARAGNHYPPRAPLAFRVGVVGHRPNRLRQAKLTELSGVLRVVLNAIQQEVRRAQADNQGLYADDTPILRAISPLAEGADRLFAEQALNLGFELCCVMPFFQDEFEKDFAPEKELEDGSLQRFRELLKRADSHGRLTRFELDGKRSHESRAYATGGRVVLNRSDLLVVVWDGERQKKRGGTEDTFDDALQRGVPIVWIDAQAPHDWRIVDAERPLDSKTGEVSSAASRRDSIEALHKVVRSLLQLPEEASGHGSHGSHVAGGGVERARKSVLEFYAERKPAWSSAIVWRCFQKIVGQNKWPRLSLAVEDFEDSVRKEWSEDKPPALHRVVERLRPHYAWPDKLSVLYADRYRSVYLLVFLLAAAAVGMALLPVGLRLKEHGAAETSSIALELALIVAVALLVFQGTRRRWHSRWLDYRLAAELVRHLRLVVPLGGEPLFPQIPAHWAKYGNPASTWMSWYVSAVERRLGLPSAVMDKEHLEACLAHLSGALTGQIEYHESSAKACHRIEFRLHAVSILLLLLTFLCCALHLAPALWHGIHLPSWAPGVALTFFCGFFPALGAALAGINNQGEFRRVAKRSEAMQERLTPLCAQVEELRKQIKESPDSPDRQYSLEAAALTTEVSRVLVNEVLDWRVVFLDQPLRPPA